MANSSQLSSPAIPPEALQYAVQQSFVYIGILQFQLFNQEEKKHEFKVRGPATDRSEGRIEEKTRQSDRTKERID